MKTVDSLSFPYLKMTLVVGSQLMVEVYVERSNVM